MAQPSLPLSRRHLPAWTGLFLLAAVGAAYFNSLHGALVFDDFDSIPLNPTIRHLGNLGAVLSPPAGGITVDGRPILNLSLALDYALGGLSVVPYHATNLLIHGLATLLLFGIVRRSVLLTRAGSPAFALGFGASAALLWGLHPLQTESVTYLIQRAESLMGLFYLATLYAFIRMASPPDRDSASKPAFHTGRSSSAWAALSVSACLLGMGTKEVMVSAPLTVLLFDRTFLAGSFQAAWSRRRGYYACLAATWALLAFLIISSSGRGGTTGFGSGISAPQYWLSQGPALAHYLRLTLWPHPLVFDYGLKRAWMNHPLGDLPSLACVLAAGIATLVALRRPSLPGFLGFVAFSILAPTSIVPGNRQTLAEHRMYLALAPVIVGLLAGAVLLVRRLGRSASPPQAVGAPQAAGAQGSPAREPGAESAFHPLTRRSAWAGAAAVVFLAAACAGATFLRNRTYATYVQLMQDNLSNQPENTNARGDLGTALCMADRWDDAIREFKAILTTEPGNPLALMSVSQNFMDKGDPQAALPYAQRGIDAAPGAAPICCDYANVLLALNRPVDALPWSERAVRLTPAFPHFVDTLGSTLLLLGRTPEAMDRFREALRLDPESEQAHLHLGNTLLAGNQLPAALDHLRTAVRLDPSDARARYALGTALTKANRLPAAKDEFAAWVALNPQSAAAHNALATALSGLGQLSEAIAQFEEATRIEPTSASYHANLAGTFWAAGRVPDCIREYQAALAIDPSNPMIRADLDYAVHAQDAAQAGSGASP